jgi:SHS2 domain-containing protein
MVALLFNIMISKRDKDLVIQYLKDTCQYPNNEFMLNRDYIEKVYDSYDYKLWVMGESFIVFKVKLKNKLKAIGRAIVEILQ